MKNPYLKNQTTRPDGVVEVELIDDTDATWYAFAAIEAEQNAKKLAAQAVLKAMQVTRNRQAFEAALLGRKAFLRGGPRVPAYDAALKPLLIGKGGDGIPVLTAWTRAWDAANLETVPMAAFAATGYDVAIQKAVAI